MINKTKLYDLFKFREDNREKIDVNHVEKLVESIKSKNLLHLRPILVNDKMEIIDGQHRVLAAKKLDVEIYYDIQKELDCKDIILMNISKSWSMSDYLNYYCQNNYSEYKKLSEFMIKNNLSLKVSLTIAVGQLQSGFNTFRSGEFKFEQDIFKQDLDLCWKTINLIKKLNGFSNYTSSSRFWKGLIRLIKHPDFEEKKWLANAQKLVTNFSVKATTIDYISMIEHIYNWNNKNKISLSEEKK